MSFKPEDLFVTVQDFFGVLVPGAVGAAVIVLLLRGSDLESILTGLSTTAQWVVFGVGSLILGYIIYPPSHLLNKVYALTYRYWKRRSGDPLLQYATAAAEKRVPNIRQHGSVYEWTRTRVEGKDPSIQREIGRIQGISKLFRSLCFYLVIGFVAFGLRQEWALSSVCFATAILCFLVFSERRFTASTLVYQRFMDQEEEAKGEMPGKLNKRANRQTK